MFDIFASLYFTFAADKQTFRYTFTAQGSSTFLVRRSLFSAKSPFRFQDKLLQKILKHTAISNSQYYNRCTKSIRNDQLQ